MYKPWEIEPKLTTGKTAPCRPKPLFIEEPGTGATGDQVSTPPLVAGFFEPQFQSRNILGGFVLCASNHVVDELRERSG